MYFYLSCCLLLAIMCQVKSIVENLINDSDTVPANGNCDANTVGNGGKEEFGQELIEKLENICKCLYTYNIIYFILIYIKLRPKFRLNFKFNFKMH